MALRSATAKAQEADIRACCDVGDNEAAKARPRRIRSKVWA
jgi:hypothetical protein